MIGGGAEQSKRTRNKFTREEDELIMELVSLMGPRAWNNIANHCPNRTARQIRERYVNYLSPKVQNTEWTDEEDALLREKVGEYGRKWSLIAKYFANRTDVTIKNRWSKLQRNKDKLSLHKTSPIITGDDRIFVPEDGEKTKPSVDQDKHDEKNRELEALMLEADLGFLDTNLEEWIETVE